ncbi:MAG: 2-oxoglutarate dehydrogenase, E2 component, dihydrolipoamide succinyltransferase [Terracidiphilus sp.]|jgi:2-oxoglutarate dehydrogenase E2 component (dihydrolipoamide succinyltransferase)
MSTDVVMPQMGESIFEGTITRWLKKTGDSVEKDEPLFEISTDKVDAEIPSPVAGILSEIKAQEGETVQINTVVAVVLEQGIGHREQGSGTSTPGAAELETPVEQADGAAAGVDVVMPQMGESIFEGTITRWLKKAGDSVEKDEPLFEISTDKVDAEIPSPAAGILTEIKAGEGETVQINTVVAVIGGAGVGGSAASDPIAVAPVEMQEPAIEESASQPPTIPEPETPVAELNGRERVRSSPLVRKIAEENKLDLRRVAGTGSEGRITKDDVLRHLSQHGPGSAAAAKLVARETAAAAKERAATAQASTLPGQVVPLSRMRAIIAQRMVESVEIAPHVYSVYKIDMTRIARLREREKGRFEQKHGVKLTYMPFIGAAAAEALRRYPIVNASLKDGSIHYHPHVDLGIAVALEWGLIVPVVKQAETLSFVELAKAMADLAERARTKKLKPEEASGSTFTLTNSGVFGGEFGTPIINQPESAILAIGGLKKEAVVLTDAEGNDTIGVRAMQSYCLGFDHRLIDGADGGKFMSAFKRVLEGWEREIG